MKKVQHLKKKKSNRVPEINFKINEFKDYERLSTDSVTKGFVYARLLESICDNINKKTDTLDLFKIYSTNKCLSIPKSKWKDCLQNALTWYTEKELYEECIECKELLNKL